MDKNVKIDFWKQMMIFMFEKGSVYNELIDCDDVGIVIGYWWWCKSMFMYGDWCQIVLMYGDGCWFVMYERRWVPKATTVKNG